MQRIGKKLIARKFSLQFFAVLFCFLAAIGYAIQLYPNDSKAAGNTYYVAKTGNDTTRDGSEGNPWLTIQKAANTLQAGDKVYIKTGTYRELVKPENSGTAENPITYEVYPGDSVVINGSDEITDWQVHSGSIYKSTLSWYSSHLYQDSQRLNISREPNSGYYVSDNATDTTMVDTDLIDRNWIGATIYFEVDHPPEVTVTGWDPVTHTLTWSPALSSYHQGLIQNGCNYYFKNSPVLIDQSGEYATESGTNTVYVQTTDNSNPSTHVMEASRRNYGFNLDGNHWDRDYNYITIKGFEIKFINDDPSTLSDGYAIYNGKHEGIRILNNTIHNAVSGIFLRDGTGDTIRDNHIYGCRNRGIYFYINSNSLIENNYIHDIDIDGIYIGGSGSSATAANNVVRNNHVRDLWLPGTHTDALQLYYAPGTIIENNLLHDSHAGQVVMHSYSSNVVYRNNIMYGAQSPSYTLMVFGSSLNLTLINNTFNAGSKVIIRDGCNGGIVKNNIFDDFTLEASAISNTVTDYNIFKDGNVYTSSPYANLTLDEYRTQTGNEVHGIGGDPGFIDPVNHNYHLQSSSIAIDAGTSEGALSTDKDGNNRHDIPTVPNTGGGTYTYYDIGAYEFQDIISPFLAQVTTVSSPTNDNTPSYVFNSDEAGTISYGGDCSSSTINAVVGDNTITFNALSDGAHSNCTVTVTDMNGNPSNILDVTAFTVDTAAPIVNAGLDQVKNSQFTQKATASDATSGIATYAWSKQTGPGTITFGAPAFKDTTVSASEDGTYVIRLMVTDNAGNFGYDEMTLVWDTASPNISSVSANSITSSSAIITWNTSGESSTSQVEYGLDTSYGSQTNLVPQQL